MLGIVGFLLCLVVATEGFFAMHHHRYCNGRMLLMDYIERHNRSFQGAKMYNTKGNDRLEENDKKQFSLSKSFVFNPFQEVFDMFSNWDDVIDDFLYKRMGNGEVFYGKRKYKPSGRPNTEGRYGGMGLTDTNRIRFAQEIKEQRIERIRSKSQERD